MTIWEIVILILVGGIVLMLEACAIMGAVGKMIDMKTKAQIELTTNLFKQETEYIDHLFDKYMSRIEKMIDGIVNKEQPEPKRMGFGD